AYYRSVLTTADEAQDVRLYDLVPYFGERYASLFQTVFGATDLLRRRLTARVVIARAVASLAAALAFLYVVSEVIAGRLSVGNLVLYGGAVTLLQSELRVVTSATGSLPNELSFLPSLRRVLDSPPDLPLDPSAGRITLDGIDLRAFDPADLRREFGALFQDFVRYDLTVRENVGLGQLDALGDPTRLMRAAAKASAAALIQQLPDGLDTRVG